MDFYYKVHLYFFIMKKLSYIFISILVFLSIQSCKSTKIVIDSFTPLVPLTVVSNSSILWQTKESDLETEQNDGLISSAMNKLLFQNDIETTSVQNRIECIYESINNSFSSILGIEILPYTELMNSRTYNSASDAFFGSWAYQTKLDDTKLLSYSNSKQNRMILQELGAKSGLFANFKFEKRIQSGYLDNGRVVLCITAEFVLVNENGKILKRKEIYAESDKSIEIKNSIYDKVLLVDMAKDTIVIAVNKFAISLL